jgi:lysozyme
MINKAGIALIKEFESLHDGSLALIGLQPKMCPAGIWTIGYGHALRDSTGHFLRGNSNKAEAYKQCNNLTELQAIVLLQEDLEEYCHLVKTLIKVPLNENQYAALVSFTYNVGYNSLRTSTLLRLLNAGDYAGAAKQFLMWNKSGGKVLRGLTRRREAERALFLKV